MVRKEIPSGEQGLSSVLWLLAFQFTFALRLSRRKKMHTHRSIFANCRATESVETGGKLSLAPLSFVRNKI